MKGRRGQGEVVLKCPEATNALLEVDSEEQEQKLLMRRREVITERRCQLRGIGGDLFVTSQSYGMLWLITPSWQET